MDCGGFIPQAKDGILQNAWQGLGARQSAQCTEQDGANKWLDRVGRHGSSLAICWFWI
jgi:hypothetical protein